MRVAVLTDIHSNLPALEAVFGSIDRAGVEQIWCLGDVVGYGADPDACTDLVRERCDLCLVGNHDLAVLGGLDIARFSETAAEAVEWTRANVADRTLEFLRDLEPAGARDGIGLFHASPRDSIWEYVLSIEQADGCMDVQSERVALIGHSHVSLYFARPDRGDTRGAQMSDGALLDLSRGTWLVNPGSAGQPRDGDPRAAWLELDTAEQTARFHRVDYDVDRAAAAIVAAGLPERLAERLHTGQ
jgi:diadenosine tetraphosphatase ApaH/serine/threonine PP2A family protein phosphatase